MGKIKNDKMEYKKAKRSVINTLIATGAVSLALVGSCVGFQDAKNEVKAQLKECMKNPAYTEMVEYEKDKLQKEYDIGNLTYAKYCQLTNMLDVVPERDIVEETASDVQLTKLEAAEKMETVGELSMIASGFATVGFAGILSERIKEKKRLERELAD